MMIYRDEIMNIGTKCIYLYRGAHGFSWKPERFPAEVIGHTKKRVKIKAFDGDEWFTATVRPESLIDV